MQTFNIDDAKSQLSRLVEQTAKGESFVIAKAGKPMVKVMALNAPEPSPIKRFGFLAGQITVPEDFDTMAADKIRAMFESEARSCCWIPIFCCGQRRALTACPSLPRL